MKIRSTIDTLALISLIITSAGRAGLPNDEVGAADEQLVASNALTVNALTTNALSTNGLVRDALRDSLAREFFSYVYLQ